MNIPLNVIWDSSSSGTWPTSSSWNDGAPPLPIQNVIIDNNDNPTKVTFDTNASILGLTIEAGAILNLVGGSLTVTEATANYGLIEINSSGVDPTFAITGNISLLGGGEIWLRPPPLPNPGANMIIAVGPSTLTNVDNTIFGSGTIGTGDGALTLVNDAAGTIDALGGTLILDTGNAINNSGILAAGLVTAVTTALKGTATGSGTLQIDDVINNAGLIEAAAGGILDIKTDLITWTGGTATAGTNGILLELDGTLLVDVAKLQLTGGGAVSLAGGTIAGAASTNILDNVDNMISGYGTIGGAGGALTLLNDALGTIDANVGGQALLINAVTLLTNFGLLEANGGVLGIDSTPVINTTELLATGGGTVVLEDGTVITNTGATVEVDAVDATHFSTLDLDNATITGGILNIYGLLDLTGTSAITDATITDTGTIEATAGKITIDPGTINNSGSLEANGGTLEIDATPVTDTGTLLATGGGTLVLNGASGTETVINFVGGIDGTVQVDAGSTLDLETATISGGNVSVAGTLNSTGESFITDVTLSNTGTIEATSGTLTIDLSTTIGNAGLMEAGHNAVLEVDGTVDNGGTIAAQDGGTLQFDNVTVNNTGTVALNAENVVEGSPTYLVIDGTLTLQGGDGVATGPGQIILTDSGDNYIQSDGSAAQLINVDNTISGAGTIGDAHLTLDNEQYGVIDADGSNPLVLNTGANTIINAGTLVANGGTLDVDSSVSGNGTVTITGGGIADFANAFNQDVTLAGAGTLALAHSQANGYTGTVSGFSAGDAIDLTDLTYSPTETDIWNSADGTLTIDNGAQTETLSLAGTYTQDNFVLTHDSGTGTEIVFSPTQVTLEGLNNDGNAVDGQPITVNLTDVELNGVTYTWLVGGQVVEGVTGNSYTPTGADDGKTLDVLVNFIDPLTQVVEHDTALAGAVVGDGFLDQTITYQYLYPTANSSYYETTIAVGSGTTHSGIYSGSTDIGNFTVDANQITFNFTSTGVLNNTSYNGWDIYEPGVTIVGFAIESGSDVVGLSNAMLSFDAHDLNVNWAGLSFLAGGTVTFNVTFDPPLDASQLNIAQTLDGSALPANNSGTLTIADGTELALAGTIDNTGAIAVDGASAATAIGINGNVTLQGGGEIDFTDSNQNYIFGDGTLINVDNTISGSGDLGNGTLIFDNAGVIETNGSYALIIDTGANPFVNTGTLETDGGTLIVNSPVSGGGNAIIAGGTLEFSGASNNNVSFSGGNAGVLALDQSQDFTGNISGFGGQDQIDLGDIGFTANTTLNYAANSVDTGGILTLSEGTHTTELCLVGNYTASSFAISSDGHGGTLLTDPSATIASSNPSIVSLGAADATGTITFADADTSDAQTAVVTPEGSGYVGTFSLDSVSESNGSGSVGWQFQLGNDQINLALGQTETQSYGVNVAEGQNTAVNQTVSVSIGGPGNDNFVFHPGVGADTIINFNAQVDTIELDHFANAQSIQQLASMITSDAHGDAVIDLGHHDSIIIPGVTANYLQAHLQSLVHLI